MRIVIVGDGKVGAMLTEQLAKEGHDIVVVDNDMRPLRYTQENLDVLAINGNGASMQVLREAGAESADLLIAATSADEINLLCCITAKKMGCAHTIARVRNPEYEKQLSFLREELGLSLTINPEFAASHEIYHILQFPTFINRDSFAKGRVEIVELRIRKGCTIIGRRLRDLYDNTKVKVLVCAVERGEQVYIPSGDFQIEENDIIHVTAETQNLTRLIKSLGITKQKVRDVVIVGGSRIGYYLTKQLLNVGMHVKIIEKDYDRCLDLSRQLPKAIVINGDGCQQNLLNEEMLGKTDAVVALMNIDEVNLIVAMYAAQHGVPKVVAKIDRMEYMSVFKHFDVESLVSPKNLICNDVLRYVRAMDNTSGGSVITLHRLVGGKVEALEFVASPQLRYLRVPLRQAPIREGILIACIRRGTQVLFPTGDDYLQANDTVIVVTTLEKRIKELSDIFSS